jgi:hypothetical protein
VPKLGRITEPDENLVHFVAPPHMGNVTLCGLTDFIGHKKKGGPTRKAVNCVPCKAIVRYIYDHDKESL